MGPGLRSSNSMRQPVELSLAFAAVSPLCRDTSASTSAGIRARVPRPDPGGLAYARAFDCKLLLSLAGVVLPDASRAAAMRTFVENLRGAADLCAPLGATLLIETNNVRDNPNYAFYARSPRRVRSSISSSGQT